MLGPPNYLPNGTAQLGHVQTPTDARQVVFLCTLISASYGRTCASKMQEETNKQGTQPREAGKRSHGKHSHHTEPECHHG